MSEEKKQPQQLIELTVVLRLTPEVHAALVKESSEWSLSIDDTASSIIEARLDERDPVEAFRASLAREGTSGEEFWQAWRRGQEAQRRDSVPLKKGTDDA